VRRYCSNGSEVRATEWDGRLSILESPYPS
jgi:hypothetical protein